jgi:PII-like signaling protein
LAQSSENSFKRENTLKRTGEGKLLRIFVGELDRSDHKPLYEVLVLRAKEAGLAGATVLRGVEGFGAVSRVIHTAKILRLSEDLPVVIEIADSEEKIRSFLPTVDALFESVGCGGMVTLEGIDIIKYTPGHA